MNKKKTFTIIEILLIPLIMILSLWIGVSLFNKIGNSQEFTDFLNKDKTNISVKTNKEFVDSSNKEDIFTYLNNKISTSNVKHEESMYAPFVPEK